MLSGKVEVLADAASREMIRRDGDKPDPPGSYRL